MRLVAATLSELLLVVGVPYFLITMVLGVRVARRGGRLGAQEACGSDGPASPSDAEAGPDAGPAYHLYFLVPCLNEAAVIGNSVRRLLAGSEGQVIVIDDASDDDTAAEAERAAAALGASDRLVVHRRRLPGARQGKGEALNAGLQVVVEDVRRLELDPNRVIIGVMDGDGRLNPGARPVLPLFDDQRIGGVQLIVRVRNRDKLITQFQDVEFWTISATSQFARSQSGTVSLGGNGQFTRLAALLGLEGAPWSRSLTEDLDLGLRLAAAGWRTTTTTKAYVDQQGVETYRRLLRQRIRWYQGHMTCIRRVPELWSSERLGQVAMIELTSYLLVPWIIVLPWSLLQQWILYQVVFGATGGVFATGIRSHAAQAVYLVLWYLVSFLPNLLIGLVYARRTRTAPTWRALVLGHLLIVWNYVGYAAAWAAVYRMVRGRTGWAKTARTSEPGTDAGVERRPEAVPA